MQRVASPFVRERGRVRVWLESTVRIELLTFILPPCRRREVEQAAAES
jgi:hypothetical protein